MFGDNRAGRELVLKVLQHFDFDQMIVIGDPERGGLRLFVERNNAIGLRPDSVQNAFQIHSSPRWNAAEWRSAYAIKLATTCTRRGRTRASA
jgi:hypothetical protein